MSSTKLATSLAAVFLVLIAWVAFPTRSAADTSATATNDATEAKAPTASAGLLAVPDYSGDLLHRSYLTGDWGGARTNLANKGVQLNVDWTQYIQGISSGGRERTTEYGGHLDYLLHLDLMRMGLLPGALITVRAESRYGNSVNGQAGPILPVNTTAFFPLAKNIDEGIGIAVTDLNYTQFLSEHFGVVVGKLDTLDGDPNEFASGRGKTEFMNAAFVFNPTLALRLPYSTLGAGVIWLPTKTITVISIFMNTADSSTSTGFNDFDNGYTWNTEVDTQYRLHDLPGGMNLGVLYSFDQDFAQINGELIFQPGQGLSISKQNSTWAVYWSDWQYLYVADPNDKLINVSDGKPDHQGVGLFARTGVADQDTNPLEYSVSGGVGCRGLIPTRHDDVYGIGYYFSKIQEARLTSVLGIRDHTQGMEAFYNFAVTPAAVLTFDVQVVTASPASIDTAVIFGGRMNLSF